MFLSTISYFGCPRVVMIHLSLSTSKLFSEVISRFSKVGAVVEAKTPEGVMEGVITKLTDASVYTVGKHQ